MSVDALLSRLSGVRRSHGDAWMAKCPAHADRSPSLSVRLKSDGRVLIHCHAGCEPQAILDALNLGWSDLFAADRTDRYEYARTRSVTGAMDVIGVELTRVQLLLAECLESQRIDDARWQAICEAARTIQSAREAMR